MPKFVFSSDHLPAGLRGHERAGAWVESMREIGAPFELDVPKSDHFRGRTEVLPLGSILVGATSNVSSTAVRVYRSTPLIARSGDDRVLVTINMGDDPVHYRQFGREVVLGRGEVTIIAMGEPSEAYSPASGSTAGIMLPRCRIPGGAASVEDLAARPLAGDAEARRLLVGHVRNLLDGPGLLSPQVEALASDYMAGLIGVLTGGTREARAESALRTLPAARLEAVRASLRRRFREPGLNAAAVGSALGLSSRYVQHLFQQDGSTFSGELTALRLDAAYGALVATPAGGVTVTDIAFRCGFADLSTFYRAFRARFGQPPSALRAVQPAGSR